MPPETCRPKLDLLLCCRAIRRRRPKQPRVNSDPDSGVPTRGNAMDQVAAPQVLEEALPSQSSQPGPFPRSQHLRRTQHNPDPASHGEVLVSDASQVSQASVALVNNPASQSSCQAILTGSPTQSSISISSKEVGYTGRQDHTRSVPAVQFTTTQSHITAGGDVGTGNVSQSGQGNVAFGKIDKVHVHIRNASPADEHQALILQIREKFGAYIVSEATLSKDIHGHPSLCYKGTRNELLERILSWVGGSTAQSREQTDVSSRALCVLGAPGSGKSTIMNTLVVELLDEAACRSPGLVSAHYSIRRSLSSTTDATNIFPTIILQLCEQQIEVAKHVHQLLAPAHRPSVFHQDFLEALFVEAVKAHGKTVFVIIDALDEACQPADLAAMLSRVIHTSPPNLRLLLATRNEHGVLQNLGQDLIPHIVHEIKTEESIGKVQAYIVQRLRDGVQNIFGADPDWCFWPDNTQLRSLSNSAGGLFIWATTAVDYILSRIKKRGKANRDRGIQDVETLGTANVNNLYMLILEKQLKDDEEDNNKDEEDAIRAGMLRVLGFIVVAKLPLALDDFVGFLELDDDSFDDAYFVQRARSILVPGMKAITGSTIPRMHKTFFDFVTTERASAFRIDTKDHHHRAADQCFAVMASKLKFNIASLGSSFPCQGEQKELARRIPTFLSYASILWWHHWDQAGIDQPPSNPAHIRAFLEDKLLFWLEVIALLTLKSPLSMLGQLSLSKAGAWILKLGEKLAHQQIVFDDGQLDVADFTKDASRLMVEFEKAIQRSIPDIYISLLAFSPGSSIVANHYRKYSAATVIPPPSGMPPRWDSWDADPRMADDSQALSISFSPCGRHLAVGYTSSRILVWDAETGERRVALGHRANEDSEEHSLEECHSHKKAVFSVCFSPSGLLIASGSKDKTIRVWDAEAGQCILGPLKGHTGRVSSVSFSPDSLHIASGSKDGIRIWDVRTGHCVLGPLKGHTDNSTIQLWNAHTGTSICEPIAGHQKEIDSLSFRPDGRRLVSSSGDGTLRIWDIQKGSCTHCLLTGNHKYATTSVCFSPEGQYVVSGADSALNRCAFRIWDAETAVCVSGPFGGVNARISSLDFSPDGKYLATGSCNGTVRLWNFKALLSTGRCESVREDEGPASMEITDHTYVIDDGSESRGRTLGPNDEFLFWCPEPFSEAIWRPSTVRILGRPAMIKPDLSKLVTGKEWLQCFPSS